MAEEQKAKVIRNIPQRTKVSTGRPRKIVTSAMRSRFAACGTGFGGFGFGNTTIGSGGNWYSPELSTDFLELPQSLDELRNYYRFFYRRDPFVGRAVDLYEELPLSKIRLNSPESKDPKISEMATKFCTEWAEEIGLVSRLVEISHDLILLGEAFVFAEDTSPDPPEELIWEEVRIVDDQGARVEKIRRKDTEEELFEWMKKNYKGWTALRVIPPEQVHVESFPFTDEKLLELVPDSKTRSIVNKAQQGDLRAQRIVDSMPQELVEHIINGQNFPLNTDPDAGSFVYVLARKKSQYEPRGHSILERCLTTLVYRDKLRQAQTSIASRHMTPYRIIYAEDLSLEQTEELREQVDLALQDPDYSIITNYQVEWDERGADGRLLDLSNEYDMTNRLLYAGLGLTEGLMTGESIYSGDRVHLDVINQQFMFFREGLQEYIEKFLLKPMCRRMGFVEVDEDGKEQVIYPRLSFTRLPLRDDRDLFDILFNLYQKGSLDVDLILEMMNIDPKRVKDKLLEDVGTVKDPTFNEVLRGAYSDVGRKLAENTDLAEKVARNLGLTYEEKSEGGGRFGM